MHLALITHPHLIQIATDTFAQLLVTDTWEKGGGWRDTQTGGWEKWTDRQADRQAAESGKVEPQSWAQKISRACESRKVEALRISVFK